jgi:hypothetical protein
MLEKYYPRLRRIAMPSISDTFYMYGSMYGVGVRYYVVRALRWAVHRHARAIIVNYYNHNRVTFLAIRRNTCGEQHLSSVPSECGIS